MTGIGCDPATDGWSWTARKAEADAPGPEELRRGLHSSSDAIASSGGGASRPSRDAVCLTGLQRSYPEIQGNLRVSLASLFGGSLARVSFFGVRPPSSGVGGAVHTVFGAPLLLNHVKPQAAPSHRGAASAALELADASAARQPACGGRSPQCDLSPHHTLHRPQDAWAAVRTGLPPLQAEAVQAACAASSSLPRWYTASASTGSRQHPRSIYDLARACPSPFTYAASPLQHALLPPPALAHLMHS